jgi:uncharacterized protein
MSNAATVQEIYEAFGRGDVPAILEHIADDCAWESWADNSAQNAGAAHMAARTGPAGAAEFFTVAGGWEIHDFQVLDIIGDGGQVAVEVVIEATPAGGARFRDEEIHLWTFDDAGKVSRLRHYTDTAKQIAAS